MFFSCFFHLLSLSVDSAFPHTLFPTFSVLFLFWKNVITYGLVLFSFTVIQILSGFFPHNFFLFLKASMQFSFSVLLFFSPSVILYLLPPLSHIRYFLHSQLHFLFWINIITFVLAFFHSFCFVFKSFILNVQQLSLSFREFNIG